MLCLLALQLWLVWTDEHQTQCIAAGCVWGCVDAEQSEPHSGCKISIQKVAKIYINTAGGDCSNTYRPTYLPDKLGMVEHEDFICIGPFSQADAIKSTLQMTDKFTAHSKTLKQSETNAQEK